jgi:hypothetical protein
MKGSKGITTLNNNMKRGSRSKGECLPAVESRAIVNETLTLNSFHDKIAGNQNHPKLLAFPNNKKVIPMTNKIRLTALSRSSGCAAKMPAASLAQVLRQLPTFIDENFLSAAIPFADAGI